MPLFDTEFHPAVSSEINALAEKTAPIAGDLVVIEDSAGATYDKKKVQLTNLLGGIGAPGQFQQVTATDAPTTTSTTDVVVANMTLTPGAGNYLVLFTVTWQGSSASLTVTFSIYVNGVQVAGSERGIRVTAGGAAMTGPISLVISGVLAAQVVDIRWRVSTGTGTLGNRNLTLIKVA